MRPYCKEENFYGRLDKFDLTLVKIRMKRQGRKQMRQLSKKVLRNAQKQTD